jgi:hypothetical protein
MRHSAFGQTRLVMQNYPPPTPYYPQDSPYRHSRRSNRRTRRYAFHPTVTDDLDDLYDDDFYYLPQNPPPAPYWGHAPQYGSYPPPPQYPAPYPQYSPYPPQYPPHYSGPGGYGPRRPQSNFSMFIAGAFVFSMIAFAAVWMNNRDKEPGQPIIIQQASPQSAPEASAPASAPTVKPSRPVQPKRYLPPLEQDMFALFLEEFGTEYEVHSLARGLRRDDIIPVQLGTHTFWACIFPESAEDIERLRADISARYEQLGDARQPYMINLRDNCTGLGWQDGKWVCGEK